MSALDANQLVGCFAGNDVPAWCSRVAAVLFHKHVGRPNETVVPRQAYHDIVPHSLLQNRTHDVSESVFLGVNKPQQ